MSSIDERLSTLEADDKTLFHQIDELKEDVRDIRRLTIAIEKIAGKVDNIGLKVDNVDNKVNGIDERLQTVEHVPVTNWNKLKQAIISSIVSVVVGGLLGSLIALVIK